MPRRTARSGAAALVLVATGLVAPAAATSSSVVAASRPAGVAAPASPPAVGCSPSPVGDAPIAVTPSGFRAIAPLRLADTRNDPALTALGAGCVLRVDLASSAPAGATAAALTVTSDRAPRPTYVTAYPCGSPRPNVSMLNPRPSGPTPNSTIVAIDPTGDVCVYADDVTDLIVDVTGWFTPDGDPFHEIAPTRALDTRTGPRPAALPEGKPAADAVVQVAIGGVVVPGEATAITATVTMTRSDADGYVTAYPCGASVPATSTNNVVAGRDRGAPAIVGLAHDGTLCLRASVATDLVVDVTGWFGADQTSATVPLTLPASPLVALHPVRVADSRNGIGWTGRFAPDEERSLDLLEAAGAGTTSVQINVTAAEADTAGYLTVHPCGEARPTASTLNFAPGTTETAAATLALGSQGDVCVYASQSVHVIVDLIGANGTGSPTLLRTLGTSFGLDRLPDARQPDFTVHCPAGGGTITIAAQAMPGATVAVDGQPGATTSSVTVPIAEDALVRVRATGADGAIEDHWLRCLPHDFPILAAAGRSATPGWFRASNMTGGTFAFILDEFGAPVWYQRTPYPVVGVWSVGGGADLAWRRWTGGGFPVESPPLGYELHDLDGTYVGGVELPGESIDWHELLRLEDGNLLVVTYPTRTVSGAPRPCVGTDGLAHATNTMVDSDLVELTDAGTEVWRWHSADHIADTENQLPICFDVHGTWALDLTHVNAVAEAPGGDLVVTARHLDAMFRVDRSTGEIEWKLGGSTRGDGTSLTIVGDPLGGPHAAHDGRLLADGHVTLHDNRTGATDSQRPRAIEYAIDTAAKTATLVWSYTSVLNPASSSLGSVRRQPDGDTVIGWGDAVGPWLEEVDPTGRQLLTVSTVPGTIFFRADKVAESTYSRDVLRSLAGRAAAPAP
jgi:hypothetical protein